jgi:hypothetical protein
LSFVKVEEKSRLSGPPVWGVQNRYFRRTRTFDRAYCLNYQLHKHNNRINTTGVSGHGLPQRRHGRNLHGPEYGFNGLRVENLPSPAGRFLCNPLISGNDGGHSIHVRELGRRGVRLYGRFEGADDAQYVVEHLAGRRA